MSVKRQRDIVKENSTVYHFENATRTKALLKELYIFFQFIKYDISVTIGQGLAITIAARKCLTNKDWSDYAFNIIRSIIYFALFGGFQIALGQITSIDEDRLNKPDRPLPMGLLTIKEANLRYKYYWAVYVITSVLFGVTGFCILWSLITLIEKFTPILTTECGWLFKNLFMAVGYISLLGSAWKMVTGFISYREWIWIASLSVSVFFLLGIQDLRDVVGDRKVGRKTLPICLGEFYCRIYQTTAMILFSIMEFLNFGERSTGTCKCTLYRQLHNKYQTCYN